MYRKNVAGQFVCFQLNKTADGTNATGITVAVRRCIDGTFAAGGGTVTEDANGLYKYAMSQADTNGNDIAFQFTGTGVISVCINIVTTACDPTVATNFGITSLPTTAVTTNASLLTSGTGTDQLSVTTGRIDVGKLLGTAWLAPGTAGTPDVNVKLWNALTTVALPLIPTVAGRTLDCSAGGEAGVDWANVGTQGSTVNLSATTVNLVNTVTTVTNQLTAAQIATGIFQDTTAGDFTTANSIGKSIMNGVALGTGLTVARATLVDTLTTYTGNTVQTGDSFARIGAAGISLSAIPDEAGVTTLLARLSAARAGYLDNVNNANLLNVPAAPASTTNITGGTITTVTNLTNAPTSGDFTAAMKTSLNAATPAVTVSDKTGFSLSATGLSAISAWTVNITGSLSGSVGSVTGLTASNLDVAISTRLATSGYTAPDNTSITAIKAKTDSLTFTVAGQCDSNIQYVNDIQVNGVGTAGNPWGP